MLQVQCNNLINEHLNNVIFLLLSHEKNKWHDILIGYFCPLRSESFVMLFLISLSDCLIERIKSFEFKASAINFEIGVSDRLAKMIKRHILPGQERRL